ncbi:hypothetical protein K9L16_02680 [Candidatus Pacearchaeota archaeon]|nr:hypothetical protein [Candidatus Pacearchaeota archaeon]
MTVKRGISSASTSSIKSIKGNSARFKTRTFTITLHEDLVKQLEKRAKKDYLTVQELIQNILWRSARRSLRHKRTPRVNEKFVQIFSRKIPEKALARDSYYCNECKSNHRYNSQIGKKHLKYKLEK